MIDSLTRAWNILLLRAIIVQEDVALIEKLRIGSTTKHDFYGWHFTKSDKYTVKSGYSIECLYSDRNKNGLIIGPQVHSLQAHTWKLKCPSKLRHFIWQIISGCLPVTKNLNSRGLNCAFQCPRCGMEEESINHVLFECPPACQTWALSFVPYNPQVFPSLSVFNNIDYLFWRLSSDNLNLQFPWILWYIWKSRNDKLYKNLDRDAREILAMTEIEYFLWDEAQSQITLSVNIDSQLTDYIRTGIWCFFDGSWKKHDGFSDQGWNSGKGHIASIMGARKSRGTLSPLHAELDALLWAMECMLTYHQPAVIFATNCLELLNMVTYLEKWPAFYNYLDEFQRL